MVAIRGGYRMTRGRHYTKLSLSSALLLFFSGMCILLLFLSFCRFRFAFCCVFCCCWSFVDVPLIFFCPANHVPVWQPRILLGTVEARPVNKVKKTTPTTTITTKTYQKNIEEAHSIERYLVDCQPRAIRYPPRIATMHRNV